MYMYSRSVVKYVVCYILLLSFIHLGISYAYYEICIPKSNFDIVLYWMKLGSPVCVFLNKVQLKITELYVFKWTSIVKSIFDI